MVKGADQLGGNAPGAMYFANEARFESSHYSQPLTEYAVGWKEPTNIIETLDFVAPPVEAQRKFEFKKAVNAEAYLSDVDDLRAIGGDFKRVEYNGETVLDKTLNKGLTMRIDLDTVEGLTDWKLDYVQRLLHRLHRNELRRGLAILDALAINTPKTWDDTAKPDNDVRAEVIASGDLRGIDANRVLFGLAAWNLRLTSIGSQTNTAATQLYQQKAQDLADFYGVDKVHVGRQRYQSAAAAKSPIFGSVVYAYYALDSAMHDDPSDIKRFWTACQNGQKFAVYEHQVSAKFVDLTVEHYSKVIGTGALGVRKLTIS